ncbi:MAG: hypothetical protein KIT34_09940 [Cyanobacteria bacterium TGS_CYA1]|nr:hypothetical protein [Cyanobacteria bacterium TGS_CYA1]
MSLPVNAQSNAKIISSDDFIRLRLKKTLCIGVGVFPPHFNRTSEQFLVSVNGENVRNRSLEQIKRILSGPAGSIVSVEIGYPNGDTEDLDIQREMVTHRNRRGNPDLITLLDNELNYSFNYSNLLEKSSLNCDLIAKAHCQRANKFAENQVENKLSIYMNCMLVSHAIGDFDSGDRFLAKAINSIKTNPPTGNIRFRQKAVVQNLIILGKLEQAEAICKYLLLPAPNKRPVLPSAITVLESYSLIPSESAHNASASIAKGIATKQIKQVTSFHQDSFWLAQYLESVGANDLALQIYNEQLQKLQDQISDAGYYRVQAQAFGLYSKARVESLQGNAELAKKDLNKIVAIYKRLAPKQQMLMNRMPEYFPVLSDVEAAKSALDTGKSIKAAPRIIGFSNQDQLVSEGFSSDFQNNFKTAASCMTSIEANKKSAALSAAQNLLNAYKSSHTLSENNYCRQNLFAINLNIARKMTDHNWYLDAEKHLLNLKSIVDSREISKVDTAWTMIAAERIYNSYKSGRKVDWSILRSTEPAHDDKNRKTVTFKDRTRVLGKAYNEAGDLKRAQFFINAALCEINIDGQSSVYLDAAYNSAKLSEYVKSDNYLQKALASNFVLSKSNLSTVLNLANVYIEHGENKKSISILEKVFTLVRSDKDKIAALEIETRLAELYSAVGQNEKALNLIEEVISRSKRFGLISEHELAAKLCERIGRFNDAAVHYYEAGKWRNGPDEKHRIELLNKVVATSNKVSDFDKTILIKTYIGLAESIERADMAKGLAYRQKAVTLMDIFDPEKPKQLSIISYIQSEQKKNGKIAKNSVDTDALAPALVAAELASKTHSLEASDLWIRLAMCEAEVNKIDLAVQHVRKGIAAYSAENAKNPYLTQILSSTVPSLIAKAGYPDKAEALMKEAQSRANSVAGKNKLLPQVQMSHHFQYLFLYKKDYRESEKVLDTYLGTDLSLGGFSPPDHDLNVCRMGGGPYPIESSWQVLDSFIDTLVLAAQSEKSEESVRLLKKILQAEIKQFGAKDYRVGKTYAEIGKVYSASKKYEDAYSNYRAAIEVMRAYEKMIYVLSNLKGDFYNVLDKLNKREEIEKFESIKMEEQKSR